MSCLLLAQMNRATDDKAHGVGSLSNLKDSADIEQKADMVILGSWPFADECEKPIDMRNDKYKETDFILQVAKNRQGRSGGCTIKFNASISAFE